MGSDPRERATDLAAGLGDRPDETPAQELMPLVYDELRRLARGFMARERGAHTLQPTAVVHEAYLRLIDQSRVDWKGRTHFRAIAARMMRRVLVDHARRHVSAKRGGDWQRVTFSDAVGRRAGRDVDLATVLGVHDALDRLARLDPRQARVVELRFCGGLTAAGVAETLGVSQRTVEGEWTHGRAWLMRELGRGDDG